MGVLQGSGSVKGKSEIKNDIIKLRKFDSIPNSISLNFVHHQEKYLSLKEELKSAGVNTTLAGEIDEFNHAYIIPPRTKSCESLAILKFPFSEMG